MKERYGYELPKWARRLGVTRVTESSIEFKWGYFVPKFGLEFILSKGGYFSKNWELDFCFIWGKLNIKLPFNSGLDSCDTPRYGIALHNDTFWIYLGGKMDNGWNQCTSKWITWELPWFNYIHDSWSIENKNGEMHRLEKGKSPHEYREKHGNVQSYPYTYTLRSGEVQHRTASICKEELVWHRKWFPFCKKVRTTIDIQFNDEVGEESGSWKGGTIGCGYDMLPGETPLDTLRRMEKERKF